MIGNSRYTRRHRRRVMIRNRADAAARMIPDALATAALTGMMIVGIPAIIAMFK